MKLKALWLALLLLAAPLAHANFQCGGPVQYLAMNTSGGVYVNVGHGVWQICSVTSDGTWGGNTITAATCRAWYSGILAAKKTDAPIMFYFASPNVGFNDSNCTAFGSWVTPYGFYHIDL
jgi:hypothetical protein